MKLIPVHSRVHFCREAVLFRQQGESCMTCLHDEDRDHHFYRLSIHGKLLMDATIWHISTMGAALRVGYGDGVADTVSPVINDTYHGLEAAAQALAPLTALLGTGTYMLADFELYPVHPDGRHALDARYPIGSESAFTTFSYCTTDAPMYLLPSQRAALLNPQRIRHYMNVLQTCPAHQAPRAVALYVNGAVALLLDGHHKVAAAAALGQRVRTLVIFPVQESAALDKALRSGEKLELCHTRWDYESETIRRSGGPLALCDECLHPLSHVHCLNTLPHTDEPREPLSPAPPWGQVPAEFCTRLKDYTALRLSSATAIPPDKIKYCMRVLTEAPWQDWPHEFSHELVAFSEVFPDSPMLTQRDRARLAKEKPKL